MRPDYRAFTDEYPHGTLAGYDTMPDLDDHPDPVDLYREEHGE